MFRSLRRALCAVAAALLLPLGAGAQTAHAAEPGAGYWHTSGRQILDAAGQPVRIAVLREQGVLVLDGPDGYESHPPKRGNPKQYPWEKALAGVRTLGKPGPP
jgi:hypothetical protein